MGLNMPKTGVLSILVFCRRVCWVWCSAACALSLVVPGLVAGPWVGRGAVGLLWLVGPAP